MKCLYNYIQLVFASRVIIALDTCVHAAHHILICVNTIKYIVDMYMWQSQVENEHYSTVSGRVISLECFIEITPDFLCPFMNDWTTCTVNFRDTAPGSL